MNLKDEGDSLTQMLDAIGRLRVMRLPHTVSTQQTRTDLSRSAVGGNGPAKVRAFLLRYISSSLFALLWQTKILCYISIN